MKILLLSLLAVPLVSCTGTAPASASTSAAKSEAKPAKVAKAKAARQETAAKPKPYPLKTCLVSGEPLDSMDEEVSTVYQGQQFKFCCEPCLKKFQKDPDKYVKLLAKEQG